ncbi:hypothetical protein [Rothia kristinae]|uniref:YkvI family membrane protein n=1 Tax=Rothia kristinae TaxID=37923 RepID=UPI0022E2A1A0|nr:hypothetical protein [Rothia kristinae]
MSARRTMRIALAFVGLVVAAGFATGQELIQYFLSFGAIGILGALISGAVMTVAGAVVLQVGSYFLAKDHRKVFRSVSHPVVAVFLDVAVTLTLFSVGFVMLAGSGATLEQQFGLPAWVGSLIMVALVMLTGLLDVDKVSRIISSVAPVIILAVLVAFIWSLAHVPGDLGALSQLGRTQESPVHPWWVSALNYTGMNLMVGVSMSLVIGGAEPSPKEAGWGGLIGGLIFTALLLMNATTLFFTLDEVGDVQVPVLKVFDHISPVFSTVMVWIIFLMVYNTAIGMFYALGRRLTAAYPRRYPWVFLTVCAIGYAVSFVGFGTLMSSVYPVIGYVGLVLIAVLVLWWWPRRHRIGTEDSRRRRIGALLRVKQDRRRRFTRGQQDRLDALLEESETEPTAVTSALEIQNRQHDERG